MRPGFRSFEKGHPTHFTYDRHFDHPHQGLSLRSQTTEQISDGIISNVSVGYTITRMDDTDEKIDGVPVFRVQTFPQEISLVSIPADKSVGIGRIFKTTIINKNPMENTIDQTIAKSVVNENDPGEC